MDFVTHAAVGGLVGRAVGGRERGSAATLGALVALLPDVDHVLEWSGAREYLLYHRTATHSLLFVGAAALVALAIPSAASGLGRARRAGVVLAALASHLFLDTLTPFGTGLLWPFSDRLETLDGLGIVAPWFAVLAVLGALLALPRGGRRAAGGALLGLLVFVAGELAIARRAERALPGGRPAALALPDWKNPLRGVAFALEDEAVVRYEVGASGEAREVASTARNARLLADLPPEILARMRLPVAVEETSTGAVIAYHAQFDAVDEDARPIQVVREPGRPWRVQQRLLGLQPLLVLAVAAAVVLLSRRPEPPLSSPPP